MGGRVWAEGWSSPEKVDMVAPQRPLVALLPPFHCSPDETLGEEFSGAFCLADDGERSSHHNLQAQVLAPGHKTKGEEVF